MEKINCIVGVTDGFIESLSSFQVSLMGRPFRMDVVPDNLSIPQEGILEIDFLKDSASTNIRYSRIRKVAQYSNSMYKTECYFDTR